MSLQLAQHLIAVEAVSRAQVEAALLSNLKHDVPFLAALSELHPGLEPLLERELARLWGAASEDLEPHPTLFTQLPTGLCTSLLAYPAEDTKSTGGVTVVAVDPLDARVSQEFEFHLGQPVRILRGQLRDVRRRLSNLDSPLAPHTRRQDTARMNLTPSLQRPGQLDSMPPIPLVRRPPVVRSHVPGTVRGVAPPPAGNRKPPSAAAEPSQEPRLSPVARSTDLVNPGALTMSMSQSDDDDVQRALGDLAVADDAEQVVFAIASGMAASCEETLVFAVRGDSLLSRVRLNYAGQPELFTDLVVPREADCSMVMALELGQFLGPPRSRDLLTFVGQPAEVCATRVDVRGRPALVFASAGFRDAFEVSKCADHLARAAADALGRIVLARKR